MAKHKTYRIQKRYEVWVEREVRAPSLEAAVELVKDTPSNDFFDLTSGTELLDITQLPGTTVGETW